MKVTNNIFNYEIALNKLYDKENIRETVVFSYEGFDIKGTEVSL